MPSLAANANGDTETCDPTTTTGGACIDYGDDESGKEHVNGKDEWEETFEYGIWLGQEGREELPYTDQTGLGITPGTCTIARRSLESLSPEEFLTEYVAKGRPVMLVGAAQSMGWAGLEQWTSLEAIGDM